MKMKKCLCLLFIKNEQELNLLKNKYRKLITNFLFFSNFEIHQLDVLETTFQQHRYPTIDMVDDLVDQLNLPTQKITVIKTNNLYLISKDFLQVWFQNRRARLKKIQQKLNIQNSFNKDDQQQYDSGIHLV